MPQVWYNLQVTNGYEVTKLTCRKYFRTLLHSSLNLLYHGFVEKNQQIENMHDGWVNHKPLVLE
jgi:hypothetical protein